MEERARKEEEEQRKRREAAALAEEAKSAAKGGDAAKETKGKEPGQEDAAGKADQTGTPADARADGEAVELDKRTSAADEMKAAA